MLSMFGATSRRSDRARIARAITNTGSQVWTAGTSERTGSRVIVDALVDRIGRSDT
jgi:hypothetical protein